MSFNVISAASVRNRLSISALALTLALGAAACGSDGGATGGTGGNGGSVGGSGGAGGGAPTVTYFLTFETDGDVAKVAIANPAAAVDAGAAGPDLSALATKSRDTTTGQPGASLKLEIPYTAYSQSVDFQFLFDTPTDLRNKIVTMQVRLDSGFTPDVSAPGGAIVYGKSGEAYSWGQAAWANISATDVGTWKELTFDLRHATDDPGTSPAFDPAAMRAVGFKLDTGTPPVPPALPTTAVFHIDSIGVKSP